MWDSPIPIAQLKPLSTEFKISPQQSGVQFTGADGSQMSLLFYRDDLLRVQASFGKSLPQLDHSWAINKTSWDPIPVELTESPEHIVLKTKKLHVNVSRSTLCLEIFDAQGKLLNADAGPISMIPDGSFAAVRKKLSFNEHFYGLGEKAFRLDKRRGVFQMWNSDTPFYQEGTDPIYQSIPFYMSWNEGTVTGTFFDNSGKSLFDLGRKGDVFFGAPGDTINYYFFAGPTFSQVVSAYTELTGRSPLWPRWALGHQQSRWSYFDQNAALAVAESYRKHDIPFDVLHLDIDYMDGYRVFTWDSEKFPEPKSLLEKLRNQNVKTMVIIDPGIKTDPNYHVFKQGVENNFLLKRGNGELYKGEVWPGESAFADFTREDVRRWWGGLHQDLVNHGVAGIWNDMNEPADFKDQTGETQKDVVFDDLGQKTLYAKNRNTFALNMCRATFEGLEKLSPNKRPYVITRAAYAGIQRYSTAWTGDNTASWASLRLSIPMFLSMGLSGEAFVGSDIGGFDRWTDPELMTRWYQVAALTPFCRNHKAIMGPDQEVFRMPDFYQSIIRKFLKLRYRLVPYLYTLMYQNHLSGEPILRPVLYEFQNDVNFIDCDDQFMVGRAVMIAPVVNQHQEKRHVMFPEGKWKCFFSGKTFEGNSTHLLECSLENSLWFVREGLIVPFGEEKNFLPANDRTDIELLTFTDKNGVARGELYQDDGETNEYRNGSFCYREFKFENGKLETNARGSPQFGSAVKIKQL